MRAYRWLAGTRVAGLLALALLTALLSSTCAGRAHPGPANVGWPPTVTLAGPPTGLRAGDSATFSAVWAGGTAPFTLAWDFGGGAAPNAASEQTAGSSAGQTVILSSSAGGTFVITVTVTDVWQLPGQDTASYSYGPAPPVPNAGPHLQLISGAGTDTITLRATNADGDDITIYATAPVGMNITSPPSAVVESGGTATFNFAGDDMFTPEGGDAGFSAFDGHSPSPVLAVQVQAGYALLPDTLYAIPLKTHAAVGEPVRIVVATGVPAHPFQFVKGVRVTVPVGTEYVWPGHNFNIGAPGGSIAEADGY